MSKFHEAMAMLAHFVVEAAARRLSRSVELLVPLVCLPSWPRQVSQGGDRLRALVSLNGEAGRRM